MSKVVSYGIFLAIILGLIFPVGTNYKFIIPYLLAIIMFFSFLKIEYKFKHFFRKELFYFLLIGLLLIPLIVFFLTKNLESNLRLGLFLVSITPTAIGAPIICEFIKGNREFIISNVVFYNILSPFSYTLLLSLFFRTSEIIIPTRQIFVKLLIMVFVPFLIAFIVRRFGNIKLNLLKISKYLSSISFVLVVGLAISSASLYLRELDSFEILKIFLIVFSLAIVSFSIGYLFSRDKKIKKTLALVFGHKNSALTTWVALSNFSTPVVIPMMFYIISHHIINGLLMNRFAKE